MLQTVKYNWFKWTQGLLMVLLLSTAHECAAAQTNETSLKIGCVDFRKCVEESKLGKKEQASFEALQNQMESSLMEIQKQLNDITGKLSDDDYVDGLSPEAENELKHKYRALNQELTMTQNQYVQTLQQANMKIVQALQNEVSASAKEVAKIKGFDLIVNEEAAFFRKDSLDMSLQIIAHMDEKFVREQKKTPQANK